MLAESVSLNRTSIGLVEKGTECPGLDTMLLLAEALKSDAIHLVSMVGDELKATRNE